jgi:hypothetical protein
MNRNRKCSFCGEKIPLTRHKSAKYCSDDHSYQAKKERSSQRYYRIKQPMDEIQRNDAILERLYRMKKDLKREFTISDLEKLGFNFGVSTEEKTDNNGRIWKMLELFGYTIDPKTKNLELWQKP